MKIRPYCENDYQKILDIYAESKLDELRFEKTKFELLPLDKDKERLAELTESDIYVYEDKEIIGYAALFKSEIRALFVCPTARSRGIGTCLLEFLLSKINDAATLYVAKTNMPAKQLYQKYGFSVTNEFQTEYNGKPVFASEMVRNTSHG
ncbi:MAG: GNAT family N-acetyltransferase [Cycloclasticus sp.]|jgi:Acetyltransferases